MYSSFLPGADSEAHSRFFRRKAPSAAKVTFGGYSAFWIAGICALIFHGAALGQTSAPEASPIPLTVWQAHNRGLLVGLDSLNRRYTEFDSQGITQDGVLDSEKGTITGGAIRGRWQSATFSKSIREIFLQAEYRRHTGSTNYQGSLVSARF